MRIYKNKDITTSIDTEKMSINNSDTYFYTEDKGSAALRIFINHRKTAFNLDNTNLTPVLDLFHTDGSIWLDEPLEVIMSDKGILQYNIPNNVITHAGKVKAKLFLKNTEQSVHVANFTFDIKDSGIEGAVEKEISVSLVDDAVRRIVKENAMALLDDNYKEKINHDVVDYIANNPDKYKGEDGKDVDPHTVDELKSDVYYDEITYDTYVDEQTNTEYILTNIPNKDKNGNLIKLKYGYSNDTWVYPEDGILETAREFSNRHNASFVANSTLPKGRQVFNGTVINNNPYESYYSMGIDSENNLKSFDVNTTAQEMIGQGYNNVVSGFYPLVINGVGVDLESFNDIENNMKKNPRQIICQKANKDIFFITAIGRGVKGSQGLDFSDMKRICLKHSANFAFNLDGGGSIQTTVRGSLVNNLLDGNNHDERRVRGFLYVEKYNPSEDGRNKSSNYDIGKLSKRLQDSEMDLEKIGEFNKNPKTVSDLNSVFESGYYWSQPSTTNRPPGSISYGVVHFQYDDLNALQMAIPFHALNSEIYYRRTIGDMDTWSSWRTNELKTLRILPNYQNGWVDFDSTKAEISYRNGLVFIRGSIKNGTTTTGTVICNLPSDYRPLTKEYIPTFSYDGDKYNSALLVLENNGDLKVIKSDSNQLIINHQFITK